MLLLDDDLFSPCFDMESPSGFLITHQPPHAKGCSWDTTREEARLASRRLPGGWEAAHYKSTTLQYGLRWMESINQT